VSWASNLFTQGLTRIQPEWDEEELESDPDLLEHVQS